MFGWEWTLLTICLGLGMDSLDGTTWDRIELSP